MVHTHQTAPTQFVEANGIRFAYRRFGKSGGVPLVFNQHFTGTMDHWDPAVTDGFAKDREVILFNNAGVSSSSGEVPTSIEGMAANAIAFIEALGLSKVDVLGFSIGGFVAQEIAGQAPGLVRKLILVGTGPRGGEGMANLTPEAQQIFGASYRPPLARRPFHQVGSKPGGRPRLPQAIPPAQGESGPRGRRKGGAHTTRSLGQMGHSVQGVV
jgi:pimeloyl-ACP methyl ester carboxylesterase